jgi:hypothetical protein
MTMHLRVFDAHAINRSVPETTAQGENNGRGLGQKRRFGSRSATSGLPDKQTSSEAIGMSQTCQYGSARTFTSPELHRSNLLLADRTKVIRVLHLSRRSLMIREEVTARYAQ